MEENVKKSNNLLDEKSVAKAFDEFNKRHSPEAVARLMELEKDLVVVEFGGSFCRSCGVYDYFDDLKFELMDVLNRSLKIMQAKEREETYLVTYEIEKSE